jgi:hypothetical protein
MLSITTAQMDAFKAAGTGRLLSRIDQWLVSASPRWTELTTEMRHSQLQAIEAHSRHIGVNSENDLAVFAWLCVTLVRDWQSRIAKPDIWDVMSDPQWRIQSKLLHLEQVLRAENS